MQPFGWLPEWPQWDYRSKNDVPESEQGDSLLLSGNHVVQSVDEAWVAKLKTGLSAAQLSEIEAIEHGFKRNRESWVAGADIESLWPTEPRAICLDVDPSLPPDYLVMKYKEALLGSSSLAFFPKQVLPKLRIGVDSASYSAMLQDVFLSPAEIDTKYSLESSNNSEFIDNIRAKDDGMRPLSVVLRQLRVRDTQLQVIIGLEVAGLQHSGATRSVNSADPTKVSAVVADLDTHFDRLCIWHAVHGSDLSEFCSSVIIPYFKARAPRKAKQLVRTFRGTLKSRSRTERRKVDPIKPAGLPNPIPAPGLLRALSLVHAPINNGEPEEQPTSSQRAPRSGGRKASRSISHPVYRQQSRTDQVEVRFKRSRRNLSDRGSRSPAPQAPHAQFVGVAPPPLPPTSPANQPPSAYIEATPTKVRTTYLESLPPPAELFGDDAIGSTDSD